MCWLVLSVSVLFLSAHCTLNMSGDLLGPEVVSAQDPTEDEEAEAVEEDVLDDVTSEDEDDEAEVEDDENTEMVREREPLMI